MKKHLTVRQDEWWSICQERKKLVGRASRVPTKSTDKSRRHHIRTRRGCTRHTRPVAVEFTVFLRATLQPPLSTGVAKLILFSWGNDVFYPSRICSHCLDTYASRLLFKYERDDLSWILLPVPESCYQSDFDTNKSSPANQFQSH